MSTRVSQKGIGFGWSLAINVLYGIWMLVTAPARWTDRFRNWLALNSPDGLALAERLLSAEAVMHDAALNKRNRRILRALEAAGLAEPMSLYSALATSWVLVWRPRPGLMQYVMLRKQNHEAYIRAVGAYIAR